VIAWLRRLIQRICTAAVRGAIVRAAGDTDEFDIIDHKTGKPK